MIGVSLRNQHFEYLEHNNPQIDFFEIITENHLDSKGRSLRILEKIRHDYALSCHGVNLSIASSDPFNLVYLKKLKEFIEKWDPFLVSDHLCWNVNNGQYLHALLPFPLNQQSLGHLVSRVHYAQEYLNRPLLFENLTFYARSTQDDMLEAEFLKELCRQTDCKILLDLNNIFINSKNFSEDPNHYLQILSRTDVAEIHLAGHSKRSEIFIDSHSTPVSSEVWELLKNFSPSNIPIVVEWDENIPEFSELLSEAEKAKAIIDAG